MKTIVLITAATMTLGACADGVAGRGAVAPDQLFAPGAARGAPIVDPMIVGDRLLAAGEPELAMSNYLKAAGTQGLTPDIKLAMAEANIKMGRLRQAERLLRDVIDGNPRHAAAMNNLGVVLLELGDVGEAHIFFKTAFAMQPSPEIRDNLRVSTARLENRNYTRDQENAFTLSRRTNGAIGLNAPEQYP